MNATNYWTAERSYSGNLIVRWRITTPGYFQYVHQWQYGIKNPDLSLYQVTVKLLLLGASLWDGPRPVWGIY